MTHTPRWQHPRTFAQAFIVKLYLTVTMRRLDPINRRDQCSCANTSTSFDTIKDQSSMYSIQMVKPSAFRLASKTLDDFQVYLKIKYDDVSNVFHPSKVFLEIFINKEAPKQVNAMRHRKAFYQASLAETSHCFKRRANTRCSIPENQRTPCVIR